MVMFFFFSRYVLGKCIIFMDLFSLINCCFKSLIWVVLFDWFRFFRMIRVFWVGLVLLLFVDVIVNGFEGRYKCCLFVR